MNPVCIPKYEHRAKVNWLGFIPIPVRSIRTVVIEFCFDQESKYDYTLDDGTFDQDWHDWNKLGGLTFNLWFRNKDAALGGWRYNPESEFFEVCAYLNDKRGNYPDKSKIVRYSAGERGKIEITRKGREYVFTFFRYEDKKAPWIPLERQATLKVRKNFWFAYRSELWFGGANNSPGPFGGVYHSDVCLDWSLKIK